MPKKKTYRRISAKRGLEQARALLKNNWFSFALAVDECGYNLKPESADPKTCKFCAVGALRNVFGSASHPNYIKALDLLQEPARKILAKEEVDGLFHEGTARGTQEQNVIEVNDYVGKKQTLAMFSSAIRKA